MKIKRFLIVVIIGLVIAGCAPSPVSIQKAIEQTQTAMPTATATVNPCTNKGWTDIAIYLKQFDDTDPVAGTSILAYLQSLQNYQDKINSVSVDSCSEQARQKIVSSMANHIYVMEVLSTGGKINDELMGLLAKSASSLKEAIEDLAILGIEFDYSFTSDD